MIYTSVWAHRGASGYAPENTLRAFLLAHKLGADGIELDVHLTIDGEVVVCHDAAVNRTSNGEGVIEQMTLAELRELDFGYKDSFGARFEGTRISTLREVYEAVRPTGMIVNVEVKRTSEGIIDKLIPLVSECGMSGRVIYSSFVFEYLRELKEKQPDAFVAPLYGELEDECATGRELKAAALHPSFLPVLAEADGEYIKRAHANGLRVHPYTVNRAADIEALINIGADAVITNYPDLAKEIRDRALRAFR